MSAEFNPSFVDARIIAPSVPPASPNIDLLTSYGSVRSPTLIPMTTSAPIDRATSAGTLFMAPPSTSTIPSFSTGGKMSGNDMVARIAAASDPLDSTTCSAVIISTDTARNGVGRSSNEGMKKYGDPTRVSRRLTCSPLLSDIGGVSFFFTPNSSREGYARASVLRRMFLNAKFDEPNSWSQSIAEMNCSSSAAGMPEAKQPPTRPPMLVPAA